MSKDITLFYDEITNPCSNAKIGFFNYFAHWKENPVRYTRDIYMAYISIRRLGPLKPHWSRDGTHYIAYI